MYENLDRDLLAELADGKFHSGVDLARKLDVSRGTIWQHIQALQERRLDVFAVRGKGYRLNPVVELLDAELIRNAMSHFARRAVTHIDVFPTIASTNKYLLDKEPPLPGRFTACLAEFQTDGQGRRDSRWVSPFAGGLCLSLACKFNARHAQFSTLPLAIGVAVRRGLAALGVPEIALKWPNDLIADERKLGGILVQIRGEAAGPAHLVIGLGLNVTTAPAGVRSGLAPICLSEIAPDAPGRNVLAGALLSHVTAAVEEFGREGFKPFATGWHDADFLNGKPVRIDGDVLSVSGVAEGVTDDGALMVRTGGRIREFVSGEVSVRPN